MLLIQAQITWDAAGKLPDPVMRLLTIAHKNSQRLVRLLNDILDIEKMESGEVIFVMKRVDVRPLVEQAIEASRPYAEKLRLELVKIPSLRDLHFAQPLDYPTIEVKLDRELAGRAGVTAEDLGRSLLAATSSSRFVVPNFPEMTSHLVVSRHATAGASTSRYP